MSELTVGSLSGLAANSYVIDVASGSQLTQPGMVLQVVSTTKTDTFSTTSTSFTDVTGLSVSITPSSASSKILVLANVQHGFSNDEGNFAFRLDGGNASSYVGDAEGSRNRAIFGQTLMDTLWGSRPDLVLLSSSIMYLDSPSTTSSTTYSVQCLRQTAGTVYVNRMGTSGDASNNARGASSITVMEIAG